MGFLFSFVIKQPGCLTSLALNKFIFKRPNKPNQKKTQTGLNLALLAHQDSIFGNETFLKGKILYMETSSVKPVLGVGVLGCWGIGVLGIRVLVCWGAGIFGYWVLGCWHVGCWGAGVLGVGVLRC